MSGKEKLIDVNQNNGFLFALSEYTVINNSLFFDSNIEERDLLLPVHPTPT